MYILGFDIGGTKCAVVTAEYDGESIRLIKKDRCATDFSIAPTQMIDRLIDMADGILDGMPEAVGISCGGPLDAEKGVILSPPNLKGWDKVEIVSQIKAHYGVPVRLQNDANACAAAEWKFGAGRGCRNMVFLTFGTGLGAGLILDGRLYAGTNGNAGEIGHIRLAEKGPVGYGKEGSFEGFCSGGGIAQLGFAMALEKAKSGVYPAYYSEGMSPSQVTAQTIAEAAEKGDGTAVEVYKICGEYLGKGLSVIIDFLNPERIVIGSIFGRSGHLLRESMEATIKKEALEASADCCQIAAAELRENIGDYAAIGAALV